MARALALLAADRHRGEGDGRSVDPWPGGALLFFFLGSALLEKMVGPESKPTTRKDPAFFSVMTFQLV